MLRGAQADWWESMILKGEHDTIDPEGLARSDNYYGWAKIACEFRRIEPDSNVCSACFQSLRLASVLRVRREPGLHVRHGADEQWRQTRQRAVADWRPA